MLTTQHSHWPRFPGFTMFLSSSLVEPREDLTLGGKTYEQHAGFRCRGRWQINDCHWKFRGGCLGRCKKNRAGHANWCGQFPRSGHRTCRLWRASGGHAICPIAADHPVMNSQNLWVAENRPRSETKIKKSMIEIGFAGAKDVKVKYMLFKVSARVSGRKLLVASVNKIEELSLMVTWECAGAPVREAGNLHGKNGMGTWWHTENPKATNDVIPQPELIRLHVSTEIAKYPGSISLGGFVCCVWSVGLWCVFLCWNVAIRKEDLFAAFEVCDCNVFFFADMWRSGKRICLLRLKCVIVMSSSLLKRGDHERGSVCCVWGVWLWCVFLCWNVAIRKDDLFVAFEVCDCDAFFFAETWRSRKRICLLRLKCVIVMPFFLLKRGDHERGFVCCVWSVWLWCVLLCGNVAIRRKDLLAVFEVCDCDAFFFAETWRSGKRICLLRLKCVIVIRFSLLKRGDQERGFVCCVWNVVCCVWSVWLWCFFAETWRSGKRICLLCLKCVSVMRFLCWNVAIRKEDLFAAFELREVRDCDAFFFAETWRSGKRICMLRLKCVKCVIVMRFSFLKRGHHETGFVCCVWRGFVKWCLECWCLVVVVVSHVPRGL